MGKKTSIFIRNKNESDEDEMMNVCGIKNDSQLYQWMKWYENRELHRLQQLIGKQYRVGKGLFEEELIETFHAMLNVRNILS